MRTRAAHTRESTLLFHLPEALQVWLLTEWVDPDKDLQAVATVLGHDAFRHLVDHPGFVLRAGRILSDACVKWLAARKVRVELLQTNNTNRYGCQQWFLNGKLHRDGDLPAIIWPSGERYWYQHGQLHRDGDLPASESAWSNRWYQRGRLHRGNDLPAIVETTEHGIRYLGWWWRGKRHRMGCLPAVIHGIGWLEWWRHGKRLRRKRFAAGGPGLGVFDAGNIVAFGGTTAAAPV